MAKAELVWRPHPILPLHYLSGYPGFSIVHGPLVEIGPRKYEAYDGDDAYRFKTEAELMEFLTNGKG